MKKYIILIILLFLTCGCSINYDLEIDDDKYKETILINGNRSDLGLNNTENYIQEREKIYKNLWSKYNVLNSNITSNSYLYKISANFSNQSDFLNNSMLNILFNTNTILINENGNKVYNFTYVRKSNDEEGAMDAGYETIKINIKSNKRIINANNDEINNGKYTWIIKPNENKSIYFEVTRKKMLTFNIDDSIYIILIVILIILVIGITLFNKSKKAQKI